MRDEALRAEGMTSSSQAVNYILQRITVDANLRWYMLGTEAFARLCVAEAERTGKQATEVSALYSTLAPHCRDDRPKVLELRERVENMERDESKSERERLQEKVRELEKQVKDSSTTDVESKNEKRLLEFIHARHGRRARYYAEEYLREYP